MSSAPLLMWDVDDVAQALRLSPHTIRKMASQRRLRRIKLGRRTLFDPADVTRYADQARVAAKQKARSK